MVVSWLGLVAGVLWASAGPAPAQYARAEEVARPESSGRRSGSPFEDSGRGTTRESAPGLRPSVFGAPAPVPLDDIPAGVRERVRKVLEHPTLSTQGPSEVFSCRPAWYYWFLDHPDRAVVVWRRLGAKCLDIVDRGNGRFGWSDSLGSDVHWDTVCSGPHLRIWFAEGRVRPGVLMPAVPVQAVVVLRFVEGRDSAGRPLLRHQADLYLHTDSKGAALAARLLGPSAPRAAEQYAAQIQMFFSFLSWYIEQHPEQAASLLAGVVPGATPGK